MAPLYSVSFALQCRRPWSGLQTVTGNAEKGRTRVMHQAPYENVIISWNNFLAWKLEGVSLCLRCMVVAFHWVEMLKCGMEKAFLPSIIKANLLYRLNQKLGITTSLIYLGEKWSSTKSTILLQIMSNNLNIHY